MRLIPLKLYSWNQEMSRIPFGHWAVHHNHYKRETLSILFPFNFPVWLFFMWRKVVWLIEGWMLRLEHTSTYKDKPIFLSPYLTKHEYYLAGEVLVRFGYRRTDSSWIEWVREKRY